MDQNQNNPNYNNPEIYQEEITFKELILKLQEFWFELWRSWWVIGLISLPFVAYFGYSSLNHNPTYEARLTFMVNEEEGGRGLGSLGGLASSFGLNIGGGGGINMAKVMALAKSKKITRRGVFERITIEGKEDFIANHILDVFKMHEKWKDNYDPRKNKVDLRDFRYTSNNYLNFGIKENTALNAITYQIHGGSEGGPDDQIFSGGQDEETGIMKFKASTPSEPLSIGITESLFSQLSIFYVEKAIEPQKETLRTVTAKCDSLYLAFERATYDAASFEEKNRNVFSQTSNSRKASLQARIQINGTAYGECLKNKELADFSLRSARPVFQVIDHPLSPIVPSIEPLLKNLFIGGLLGCFLGISFVIARKIYRDAMSMDSMN